MSDKPVRLTQRGFAVYGEFTDSRGQDVRVQESSEVGEPRCWVFCDRDGEGGTIHLGKVLAFSPYLTVVGARELAAALLAFADEGGRQ